MAEPTGRSQSLDMAGIFHYVLAALIFLNGLGGVFFMGIGSIAVMGILSDKPDDMSVALLAVGMIFFAGPLIFMALMGTLAILVLMAGLRISRRASLGFCQVVAGLECLFVPLGTILGIVTLVLLSKEEVRKEF